MKQAAILVCVLLAAGCGSWVKPPPNPAPTTASTWPPGWTLPDHRLTPGAYGSDQAGVCPHVAASLEAARPSTETKALVFELYRNLPFQRASRVVDHLVPLALDGRNVVANLWPQPKQASYAKDRLERVLHRLVCAGRLRLGVAQRAVAADWRQAYARYVGAP